MSTLHSHRILTDLFVIAASMGLVACQSMPATHSGETAASTAGEKPNTASQEPKAQSTDESAIHASPSSVNPEDSYPLAQLPTQRDGTVRPLTVEETMRLVLANSNIVRLQQLEIVKSDTDIKKEESRYAPRVDFRARYYQKEDRMLPSTLFTGTRMQHNVTSAGIEKLFETGTYARIEGSDTRYDSNAGEGLIGQSNSMLAMLAQPPIHTGALTVQLQQDLMKNAFGYSQKRMLGIARQNSLLQRERIEYQLSLVVAKTLIDYWNLSVAEQEVNTAQLRLKNATHLRNVTAEKLNLGISEPFELHQWNALVSAAEIQLQTQEFNRDKRRSDLLRQLSLDPSTKLTGATRLADTFPTDTDVAADTDYALQNRPDLKAIDRQIELARLASELAENNRLPTMRIGGFYSNRNFGRHFDPAVPNVPTTRYPEAGVEFYAQVPLWDEGATVEARNARISMRQLQIQKNELHREVREDVSMAHQQLRVAFEALQKSRAALKQTEAFYAGLQHGYRSGRFPAVAVKNGLDGLLQAREGATTAAIQYNMALVHYDLVSNRLFSKNHIDIHEVISRAEARSNAP